MRDSGQLHLDIFQLVQINVDQFYGIEIEEWPARIAEVAARGKAVRGTARVSKVEKESGRTVTMVVPVSAPPVAAEARMGRESASAREAIGTRRFAILNVRPRPRGPRVFAARPPSW